MFIGKLLQKIFKSKTVNISCPGLTEIKNDTEHYFIDENDQRHGEYKRWYLDGQLWAHCYYVDGNIHGEFKEWYLDGKLWEHCFYVDGKRHGEYKRWHDNGQLWMHCYYVDGKLHGEYKAWYSDGKLWEHCYLVDGKRHGEFKSWNLNGQLFQHYFYVDDKEVIDFRDEPEEYPTSAEVKTYFALKYGSAKWLL
jgi:antitoxin component YwqK of YwqJK toxin-antitoxin module